MTTLCWALQDPPAETVTVYVPGVVTVIAAFEPSPFAQVYVPPPVAVSVRDGLAHEIAVRLFVVVIAAEGCATIWID
jgi:hypothetical protein